MAQEQLLALPHVLEGESSVHTIPTDHFSLGQRKFLVVQRDVDMVFAVTNDTGSPVGAVVMLIGTLGMLCVLFQYGCACRQASTLSITSHCVFTGILGAASVQHCWLWTGSGSRSHDSSLVDRTFVSKGRLIMRSR